MQRLSLILFRYELLPDNQSLSFLPDHKIPLSFLQKELLRSEGLHRLLRLLLHKSDIHLKSFFNIGISTLALISAKYLLPPLK